MKHKQVPLPNVVLKGDDSAHQYPLQIARQTAEFMEASLLHGILGSLCCHALSQVPNGDQLLQEEFEKRSGNEGVWRDKWVYVERYSSILDQHVFGNALITMCSCWDWYVRHLAAFISFSRSHLSLPSLTGKVKNNFKRISYLAFRDQIRSLTDVTDLNFQLEAGLIDDLQEMYYVRNLGLHNRWEVDQTYLDKRPDAGVGIGDLRTVEDDELKQWYSVFKECVHSTAITTAKAYRNVPAYQG